MLFTKNNLDGLLKEWGSKKRTTPSGNEALKAKVIAELNPSVEVRLRRPVGFWGLALAGSALVAFILVINWGGRLPLISPAQRMENTVQSNLSEYSPSSEPSSASDELGIQYGASTGLGQSDPRADSVLNKVTSNISRYFDSAPSSDTREFLKTDYQADVRTRRVEKIGTQIKTMARGYGGRVDNISLGAKSAYISFVIPKSSLEAFRSELKDLVPARFLTENIGAQNMLPEKRLIEAQTDSTDKARIALEKDRQLLISRHQANVNYYQRQLNATNKNISTLKMEVATTTAREQEIAVSLAQLSAKQRQLEKALAQENNQYGNDLNYLDVRLKEAEYQLESLVGQDQALNETVETVQGSISIQWIGLFEIITLYVPISWLVVIFGAVIVVYFLFGRRQSFELP